MSMAKYHPYKVHLGSTDFIFLSFQTTRTSYFSLTNIRFLIEGQVHLKHKQEKKLFKDFEYEPLLYIL